MKGVFFSKEMDGRKGKKNNSGNLENWQFDGTHYKFFIFLAFAFNSL